MNLPPHPTYKTKVDELEGYYKEGFREIVTLLKTLNPNDPIKRARYEALLKEIQTILGQIDEKTYAWTQEVIGDAFEDSQARALVTMGIVGTLAEARTRISTTEIVRDRSRQMIEDTFEDLLQATKHTERKVKKIVREIVADSLRQNAVKNIGRRQNVKEITERLYSKGFSRSIKEETFIGIVDKAGRRWDLQTYSKMVVKTKIQQAQIEGARLEALQLDSDLAIISSHGAKDSCKHFEGLVVSMNGLTRGYPTLSDLRGSGLIFHPNCQHTVHPIGSFNRLPSILQDKHERTMEKSERAMANPKQTKSQDQKELRRK